MYKIERGSLEEYTKLADNSIESGKLDYSSLEGCRIYKLTHNGEPLVLLGVKKIEFEEYPGKPFLCVSGVFRKDIGMHKRVLLEAGPHFLDTISKYPLIALADQSGEVYNRFLKKFGFVFTESIEKDPEFDTIYNVYVRC